MTDVATEHPRYTYWRPYCEKMRDCLSGQDAIARRKGFMIYDGEVNNQSRREVRHDWHGERYLPRLYNHEPHEYVAYRDRATWLDATKRTLAFYLSLIFKKRTTLSNGPDSDLMDRIGPRYEALHEVAQEIAYEYIGMGRVGVMVDTSETALSQSVQEREQSKDGPFIAIYPRESIINWKKAPVNGRDQLVLVTLRESRDVSQSEFGHEHEDLFRVLRLRDGQFYTSTVYDAEGNVVEPETTPLMDGAPLDRIPFWLLDVAEDTMSPLDGIANLNIAHWRNTADLENAAHKIGVPTAIISGWDADGDIFLGADRALVSANGDLKGSFLEFHGVGMAQLIQVINDKRRDMANLGARLLMDESRFNEAAETVAMRKSGEAAIIVKLANDLSLALTDIVRLALEWDGTDPGEARLILNRDLIPHAMSHQMVVAVMNLYISGTISHRIAFERLKDGEIVDAEEEFEEVLKEIEEDQERQAENPMAQMDLVGRHSGDLSVGDPSDNGRAGGQVTASRGNE